MKTKLTEEALAEKFIGFFGDNADVYPEVPMRGGICDFVVKAPPVFIAVEVKTSMNMDVLAQAVDKIGYANYIYVAVPHGKGRGFVETVCKSYGIGILYYNHNADEITERLRPKLFRKIVKPELQDWMKQSIAGSQSVRMTAFKHFINELYKHLTQRNGATYQELHEMFEQPYYKKLTSFKSNIYQYVNRGVIKHIEIDKGKLFLDKEGYEQYKQEQIALFGNRWRY